MTSIFFEKDHLDYILELLNNERYTGNANAQLAESLIAKIWESQIVASEATANLEAAQASEDAYWSAREAELLDECVEADALARKLGY